MAYEPRPLPIVHGDAQRVVEYLFEELQEIARAVNNVNSIQLDTLHAEPEKPREGMIVLADGTDWNPGSGEGVYAYYGGAWNKLG